MNLSFMMTKILSAEKKLTIGIKGMAENLIGERKEGYKDELVFYSNNLARK